MATVIAPDPAALSVDESISNGRRGRAPSKFSRNLSLATELAVTQFKLKYTGSMLGYLWSFVKPMLLFGITYVIFVKVLNVAAGDPTFGWQLLFGIVIWTFFADATSTAMQTITGSGHLIRKASFPRWTLIAASTFTALSTFVINFTLVLVIAGLFGGLQLGWTTPLALLFIAELCVLAIGIGLLLSSLFVFFRDIGHIWEIFIQVLFYGSMVVFPYAKVPKAGLWRHIIFVNPIAQVVEDMRHVLVAPVTAPWTSSVNGGLFYLVPLGVVAFTLGLGALVFRHLSPRFAEAI